MCLRVILIYEGIIAYLFLFVNKNYSYLLKIFDKLQFVELSESKALFLYSARKGRKEADIGEALTAKPIGTVL